MLGLVPQSPDK